jgi:hypothetical protein
MSVADDSSLLECDTVFSAWTAWSWMKALWFFKMSGNTHPTRQSHIWKDFNLQHRTFLFCGHYLNTKSAHIPSANASSAAPYVVNMQLQIPLFQIVTSTFIPFLMFKMWNEYVKTEKRLDLFIMSIKKWSEVGEINRMSSNSLSNQLIGQTHITLWSLLKPMKLWKISHLSLVYEYSDVNVEINRSKHTSQAQ